MSVCAQRSLAEWVFVIRSLIHRYLLNVADFDRSPEQEEPGRAHLEQPFPVG